MDRARLSRLVARATWCGVVLWGAAALGQANDSGYRDPIGSAVHEAREAVEGARRAARVGVDGAAGEADNAGGAAANSEEMRVTRLLDRLMTAPAAGESEEALKTRLDRLVGESGSLARRLDVGPLRQAVLVVRIQGLYTRVTRWANDPLNEGRLAEMRRSARQVVACRGGDSAAVGDYWQMMAELVEINGQGGLNGAERRRLARREMNRYLERYPKGAAAGAVRDAVFALNVQIERDRAEELRARSARPEVRDASEGENENDETGVTEEDRNANDEAGSVDGSAPVEPAGVGSGAGDSTDTTGADGAGNARQ